jgi:hypothetical protein
MRTPVIEVGGGRCLVEATQSTLSVEGSPPIRTPVLPVPDALSVWEGAQSAFLVQGSLPLHSPVLAVAGAQSMLLSSMLEVAAGFLRDGAWIRSIVAPR